MASEQKEGLRRRLRNLKYSYNRTIINLRPYTRSLVKFSGLLAFVAAILCIITGIVFVGFEHTALDAGRLSGIIRGCQIVFIAKVIVNILLKPRENTRNTRLLKWIVDIAILLTLPALLYPNPGNSWLSVFETVLYNRWVIYGIIGAFAIAEFSYGLNKVLDRKINPSMMLALSFLFIIVIGSLLLMMPRCTVNGIDYVDSLFVSTSAVCVTGLTPVDVATTFTPFGLLILSLMIQIGGLGLMTFTSFFALFFTGNNSVHSQVIVKDMIYSKTINSVLSTLLYILGFTLVIELIGAVAIFFSIHGTLGMTLQEELVFSGFHSLSAFCNAGLSNLEGGLSNPVLLETNQSIYLIASALIFLGGIGFPILVNLKSALFSYIRRLYRRIMRKGRHHEPSHIYDMNTKVVLVTTGIVIAVSTLLFFIFEYNNTLAGMSLSDKIVQSIFNAIIPRTAGFMSVSHAEFLNITIIMMVVLMWIGGGAQSTAGGIKVNTLAVIVLELKAMITGKREVVVYNRTISHNSIRRACAVVALSIFSFVIYSMIIVALEPTLPVKALIYETASALYTVGLSLGITENLCDASKILLCTAMFIGRVGLISMLMGIAGQRKDTPLHYPVDNVIIN